MGSISVRKLDSDTISRLRIKAAGHGVSMEEEARRILTAAVTPSDRIGDLARSIFGRKTVFHWPYRLEQRLNRSPLKSDRSRYQRGIRGHENRASNTGTSMAK